MVLSLVGQQIGLLQRRGHALKRVGKAIGRALLHEVCADIQGAGEFSLKANAPVERSHLRQRRVVCSEDDLGGSAERNRQGSSSGRSDVKTWSAFKLLCQASISQAQQINR